MYNEYHIRILEYTTNREYDFAQLSLPDSNISLITGSIIIRYLKSHKLTPPIQDVSLSKPNQVQGIRDTMLLQELGY